MKLKLHPFSVVLLFCGIVLLNLLFLDLIEQMLWQRNSFSYEKAFVNLRNQEITLENVNRLKEVGDDYEADFYELLTMYYSKDNNLTLDADMVEQIAFAKQYQPEEFYQIKDAVTSVWKDIKLFPVGKVTSRLDATVAFENSWMQSRSYGGERGHEGTDIMASVNERGIYPIYSMTDGVVEKIGWLPQGGYRIGIRSPSGGYFYYAHLSEYAKDFAIGETIQAGNCLGMMGDTGYSEIEGTTGNFDVHLHLGIYVTIDGTEYSVNSYPVLLYLAQNNDLVSK